MCSFRGDFFKSLPFCLDNEFMNHDYDYNNSDIKKAARVFFSNDINTFESVNITLNKNILKKQFRSKVAEFHPDKAVSLGKNRLYMEERFKEINNAYQILLGAVEKQPLTIRRTAKTQNTVIRTTTSPKKSSFGMESGFHHGLLPCRKLKFAEFLYYTGHIRWHHIIESVSWQQSRRPRLGELAKNAGYLNQQQIFQVHKKRKNGQKFGMACIELQMLSIMQLKSILNQQNQYKLPIGRYFRESRLLGTLELSELLEAQKKHNQKYF